MQPLFMIKKGQREKYKKELDRIRMLAREAKALKPELEQLVKIPTMKELDKMRDESVKKVMGALRKIRKWGDLVGERTEKGGKLTYTERIKLERDYKVIEERKAKNRKRIIPEQAYYLYASDFEIANRPKPFPNIKHMTQQGLDKLKERFNRQGKRTYERNQVKQYVSNYIKSLYTVYGRLMTEREEEVRGLLSRIPEPDWWLVFESYDYLSIDFRYLESEGDQRNNFEDLIDDLKRVIRERYT